MRGRQPPQPSNRKEKMHLSLGSGDAEDAIGGGGGGGGGGSGGAKCELLTIEVFDKDGNLVGRPRHVIRTRCTGHNSHG